MRSIHVLEENMRLSTESKWTPSASINGVSLGPGEHNSALFNSVSSGPDGHNLALFNSVSSWPGAHREYWDFHPSCKSILLVIRQALVCLRDLSAERERSEELSEVWGRNLFYLPWVSVPTRKIAVDARGISQQNILGTVNGMWWPHANKSVESIVQKLLEF